MWPPKSFFSLWKANYPEQRVFAFCQALSDLLSPEYHKGLLTQLSASEIAPAHPSSMVQPDCNHQLNPHILLLRPTEDSDSLWIKFKLIGL